MLPIAVLPAAALAMYHSAKPENKLKQLGASGVLKANKTNAQVVVGTKAELIAEKIKKELNN